MEKKQLTFFSFFLNSSLIDTCDVATPSNNKEFPVAKSDGTSCRVVGDWRGVNSLREKLLWHTESCDQLLRHIPADAKVFAVIDTESGYHQLRVDDKSQGC